MKRAAAGGFQRGARWGDRMALVEELPSEIRAAIQKLNKIIEGCREERSNLQREIKAGEVAAERIKAVEADIKLYESQRTDMVKRLGSSA